MDFQPGDVVTLRSGGPQMTVKTIDAGGNIFALWFNGQGGTHELKSSGFPAITLQKAETPQSSPSRRR